MRTFLLSIAFAISALLATFGASAQPANPPEGCRWLWIEGEFTLAPVPGMECPRLPLPGGSGGGYQIYINGELIWCEFAPVDAPAECRSDSAPIRGKNCSLRVSGSEFDRPWYIRAFCKSQGDARGFLYGGLKDFFAYCPEIPYREAGEFLWGLSLSDVSLLTQQIHSVLGWDGALQIAPDLYLTIRRSHDWPHTLGGSIMLQYQGSKKVICSLSSDMIDLSPVVVEVRGGSDGGESGRN